MATFTAPPRYVRKDRRIFRDSPCLLCGTHYGISAGDPRAHRVFTCLACGAPQCDAEGLSNGQCSICLAGLLEGWSGSQKGQACSYKGCRDHAVARGRGRKLVCLAHLVRQRPTWATDASARRDTDWQLTPPTEVPYPGDRS